MRLQHIELSGFRGFATKRKFDLSADAIIIIGANGLGKTSLLDAIHWGLSGRLDRLGVNDEPVLSLYAPSGQARVSLSLLKNGKELSITRVFDGESQSISARIDKDEYKGASATARIFEEVWPDSVNAQDGAKSLSSALSRSVYLQQDLVREFLENTTNKERFNVISELVGAGRLTELQEQLEKESRSWSRASNQMEKDAQPFVIREEALKGQLTKLKGAANLGTEFDNSKWSKWWEKSQQIEKVTVSETPSPTASDTSTWLDRTMREIQSIRVGLRRRGSLALHALELMKKAPPALQESIETTKGKMEVATKALSAAKRELKVGQERVAELRKSQVAAQEVEEQKRALAQIALEILDSKCPVCQQDYDVEGTRNRLRGILDSDGENRHPAQTKIDISELAAKEKLAAQQESKLQQLLKDAMRAQLQRDSWKKEWNNILDELHIQEPKAAEEKLEQIIVNCQKQDSSLKQHASDGEHLSLNLARESAIAKIKSTEADLEKAQGELRVQRFELRKRGVTSATSKLLIEQLREARSKVAIDKLSEIEPLLQRIFARIDPHPAFRVVKFATDVIQGKGILDAEILDDSEDKSSRNPETIFSSSQLNALAVSVFLSFNLSLPNLPLQAALLDDPIQSLDDINLLGLVDLLRRTKDRRQVIVSTHDRRFGNLLSRKLRPANKSQTTSVIELNGWKRTGPEVNQYLVPPDEVQLRLVAT